MTRRTSRSKSQPIPTTQPLPSWVIEIIMAVTAQIIARIETAFERKNAIIAEKDNIIAAKDAQIAQLQSDDATEDAAFEEQIATSSQRISDLEAEGASDDAALEALAEKVDPTAPVEQPTEETPVDETPVNPEENQPE